jgi:hypothetical protein
MGLALSELRGAPGVALPAGATRAGLLKYGAATAAGAAVLALLAPHSLAAAAPLAILAFYVVEGFGAFVFPALAAGIPSPFHESLASVKSSGGIAAVVPRILVIASVMLFGGFAGRGFLRSWCIGCLAMVLWHRAVRG